MIIDSEFGAKILNSWEFSGVVGLDFASLQNWIATEIPT
jgi:hypothetical protein